MEFIVERKRMETIVQSVYKVISGKSPIRSLEGIKLTLDETGLIVRGSDSDLSAIVHLPISSGALEVVRPGEILVNGKFLADILHVLEGDKINFDVVEENLLKIKDQKSEFSIHLMVAEEYPDFHADDDGQKIVLPAATLKEIIRQTIFAVPVRDSRPILLGVSFRLQGKMLECAASDTYRLSRRLIPISEDIHHETIIPARTLNVLSQIINDQPITISFATKSVTFRQEGLTFISKIINGPYPEVARLIPQEFSQTLAIKAPSFIKAIESAALMYSERSSAVEMTIDQNQINISSKNAEVGYANVTVDNGIFVGESFKLAFNPTYIIEALRALGSEDIIFYFAGDMRPFIIKNEQDDSLVQVILPLRG